MPPSAIVRLARATPADARRLAEMSRRAFNSDIACGAPCEQGPPGYDSPDAHVGFINNSDYYKIIDGEALVGGVMIFRHADGHYEYCGLFVDPDHHNRGIAAQALESTWTRYPDATRWTAETPAWNTRTAHFYQKLGFRRANDPHAEDAVYERIVRPSTP